MSNRYNNLENNLTTLQDFIKRDSASYKEEFLEQYRHYENTLKLFQLQPDLDSSHLIDVVTFLSQVAHCYPPETKRLGVDIHEILAKNGQILDPFLRLSLCKCLVTLRNKNLTPPLGVLQLFFDLVKIKDKSLRKFIFDSTISYAKFLHSKKNSSKLSNLLQSFVITKIQDGQAVVARSALLICVDLYRRRIWQDAKTVNAVARACFQNVTKIFVAACKFFLGRDIFEEKNQDEVSSDDDADKKGGQQKTLKEIMVGYRVGKKSRRRKKQMERAKENLNKVQKKQSKKLKTLDFSALHYLYDPQEFVENLLKKSERNVDRFEVKLLTMALTARVIGVHKLQLLNFYPYLQKYLQPHQRDVTKMLLFAAQATHELVPPDVILTMLKSIVNNFVTDRASSEAITVGLNAVREIVAKCPLAMDEDLLSDLIEYRKYKNKNVSMAAKSIVHVFRDINPAMLKKKDRGQPTEAMKEIKPLKYFAEQRPEEFVPGAECLTEQQRKQDEFENNSDEDGSSSDEGSDFVEEDEDSDAEEELEQVEVLEDEDRTPIQEVKQESEKQKAVQISESRIFSQEDFQKIAKHQLKKKILPAKGRKRKAEDEDDEGVESDDSEDSKGELARLKDIERLHKRPKQDKAARLESVKAGREGREKFGRPKEKGPHVGRTNKNMAKRKAFMMVKQKQSKKTKKRSFRDKQQALRKYLLNQKKMR